MTTKWNKQIKAAKEQLSFATQTFVIFLQAMGRMLLQFTIQSLF